MIILRRLLYLLRPFKGLMSLSVLMGTATVLSAIGLMGTSAYLIAGAALHPSIAELQVAIVGVRFFGLSRGIFRYLERLASHSVNFHLLEKLRVWFFGVVERLAPASLQDEHSGDLLGRSVGDIETLENFYVRAIAPPLTGIMVTLILGIYVGQLSWGIATTLCLGLFLSGFAIPIMARWVAQKPGRAVIGIRARLNVAVVDSVQGNADLLVFGAEKRQLDLIQCLSSDLSKEQRKMLWAGGISSAGNLLLANLTLVAILLMAIPFIQMGRMDGILLAVLALITITSFEAVSPLSTAAQHLDGSIKAGSRIFDLEKSNVDAPSHNSKITDIDELDISIRKLGLKYSKNREWALREINMELSPGKQIVLMGASGSGKSSIFNLLLRFWDYQEGGIYVAGLPIQYYSVEQVRQRIAWLPQKPYIFTGTLRQNLSIADPNINDDQMWQVLRSVGLLDWASALPEGLDSWIGERGQSISGGESQRISIARVLLHPADLLLLDEPDVYLDVENRALVMDALRRTAKGKRAIWAVHHIGGLEDADEIIVLHEGRIVERGDFQQLSRTGKYFIRLVDENTLA